MTMYAIIDTDTGLLVEDQNTWATLIFEERDWAESTLEMLEDMAEGSYEIIPVEIFEVGEQEEAHYDS